MVYPLPSPVAQLLPSFLGGWEYAGNFVRMISAQSSFNLNGSMA